MSLAKEALELAAELGAQAALAALKEAVSEEHLAEALDATAERIRFRASGQRKLDARRRQKAGG